MSKTDKEQASPWVEGWQVPAVVLTIAVLIAAFVAFVAGYLVRGQPKGQSVSLHGYDAKELEEAWQDDYCPWCKARCYPEPETPLWKQAFAFGRLSPLRDEVTRLRERYEKARGVLQDWQKRARDLLGAEQDDWKEHCIEVEPCPENDSNDIPVYLDEVKITH